MFTCDFIAFAFQFVLAFSARIYVNVMGVISATNKSDQWMTDGNILNENNKTWEQENRFFFGATAAS